jgi:deazaflavin-dependent oxidoreductase (nitroreductase family)
VADDIFEINRKLIDEFRANHGRLSGRFENSPLLILTTTGRRSGEPRTAPMMYVRDGDRYIVFASNAGAVKPPYWYTNLLANPKVTVEVGQDRFETDAVVTSGEERERIFAEAIKSYPFFVEHEERAGRQIPLVALEPAEA